MSERWLDGGGEEPDFATVAHDDLLLDALGRGGPVADPDDVTAMLAAWHADVTADGTDADDTASWLLAGASDTDGTATGVGTAARHADVTTPRFLSAGPGVARVRAGAPGPARGRARRRPFGRQAVRLAAAVVAALVLATGLGVGTRNAGPTSPLWALTKVLHPERAEVLAIEHTIGQARAAVAAGRFDEARQLIDQAERDLARVTDPADVARLRAEIDGVRRDLAAAGGCPTWPRCGPSPRPAVPSPAASAARTPGGGRAPAPRTTAPPPRPAAPAPAPSPTSSAGSGPLPPVPPLPLPSVPGPSVLPSLPGLPLPTGGLLG